MHIVSQSHSVLQSNGAPMQVTRTQMWSDLLGTGVDGTKIDRKPKVTLLGLWKQLRADQRSLLPTVLLNLLCGQE